MRAPIPTTTGARSCRRCSAGCGGITPNKPALEKPPPSRSSYIKPQKIILSALLLPAAMFAADEPKEIPLWPKGAPGFEDRRNEPERAQDYWIRNIHNPSITVFLPLKEKATGAAVLVCPGGGHRELVFNAEG